MTKFAKKRVRVDLNYLSKQLTTLKFSEEDHQCTFLVEQQIKHILTVKGIITEVKKEEKEEKVEEKVEEKEKEQVEKVEEKAEEKEQPEENSIDMLEEKEEEEDTQATEQEATDK